MNPTTTPAAAPKPENIWLNLLCNVILPGFFLNQLSQPERLGPVWGLVVSLALPLGYGVWDLATRRTFNIFSILGFVSTLATGVLGLLKTDAYWVAVKEAAIPLLLGLAIPLSLRTRQPLVKVLLFNDQVLDTHRIQQALAKRNTVAQFELLLGRSSWILAGSFLISAALNFILARWLLTAAPGSPEFNAQLGKMNWVSWPVIVVPSFGIMLFALFRLMKGVERLSGLKPEEIFRMPPPKNQTGLGNGPLPP